MILYPYPLHPIQVSQLFPQRHPDYPEIHVVYHYGERFYSAAAVDKLLLSINQNTSAATSMNNMNNMNSVVPTTITTEVESSSATSALEDSPRSIISESSHTHSHGGHGSRSIGKRNQQFYLPDGCVKLIHVSADSSAAEEEGDRWYGRYDKEKNTIMRTTAEYDLPDSVDVCEYETLAHFAQEHDKEYWGNNYVPAYTHNVWKNPNYKYYNTVTLKWEPLSRLR